MRNWKYDTGLMFFGFSCLIMGRFIQMNSEEPSGLNKFGIAVWFLCAICGVLIATARYDHYRKIAINCEKADVNEG